MDKKRIISIDVSTGSFESQMKKILDLASKNQSAYICVANVHMLIEANKDMDFADIVNEADLVTPDGMPLAKSIHHLYNIEQERVAGVEIIQHLLNQSIEKDLKVGFYGGTQEIQDKTKIYVENQFPNLEVTHYKPHPFRELSEDEEKILAKEFNDAGTQILFVATGCPRQEKWMAMQKGNIHAAMIGIGGALTVVNGMKKNAPEWMRRNSLEWFYRLALEPKRLFKRYAVTNTTFLYLITKEMMKKRKN